MTDTLDLRNRLLLWHRVLAQMTGTLSLSYGRKGLKKAALQDWAERLETVAKDMRSIQDVATSRLDIQGRDVLRSAARTAPLADVTEDTKFFSERRPYGAAQSDPVIGKTRRSTYSETQPRQQRKGPAHDVAVATPTKDHRQFGKAPSGGNGPVGAAPKSPRKATRKTK